MQSLLFVCAANRCRSPMAEAVFRHHAPALGLLRVESAGVRALPGEPIEPRAMAALRSRGYQMPRRWASRGVSPALLAGFDHILAMDAATLQALQPHCAAPMAGRLALLLDVVPARRGEDVRDPYFGTPEAFTQALDAIEGAVRCWAQHQGSF